MTDRSDLGDSGDELAMLRALRAAGPGEPVRWEQPPAELWERIAAEALPADTRPAKTSGGADIAVDPGLQPVVDLPVRTVGVPPADVAGAVVPSPRRRPAPAQHRRWWIAAAAAFVIAVAAGVLVIAGRSSGPDVLASTTLERLGPSGTGRAELVEEHGNLQLRVSTSGLPAGPGFFEVWVIDPSITKLVSLGPLRSDGTYDLPTGLDPQQFPIVDISLEPIDGVATHSGNSQLRGELQF